MPEQFLENCTTHAVAMSLCGKCVTAGVCSDWDTGNMAELAQNVEHILQAVVRQGHAVTAYEQRGIRPVHLQAVVRQVGPQLTPGKIADDHDASLIAFASDLEGALPRI